MFSMILLVVLFSFNVSEAFFLFKEKHEPIVFCVKICPLYCSPRRQDEDASSLIFSDEQPDQPYYPYFEDHEPHPYHRFCKPPKPTTPKPTTSTTTTHKPYFYHDFFDDFGPPPYHYCCEPKPTTTSTTEKITTTAEPSGICIACRKKCGYPPKTDYLL